MEEQAATLLANLRKSSIAIDAKLAQFNQLKSSIKHLRVPDAAQPAIFDCVRIAISSQLSPTLVTTGLSTLGHLIKRLSLQEQGSVISSWCGRLLPVLVERLGDSRESHRTASSQCLTDLWSHAHGDVERHVLSTLAGQNSRAKEMGMMWVVKMHKNENLPFKKFVPFFVTNLEDHEGSVRETAKAAVIELFRDAPDTAKADLKKQLKNMNVRKTIADQITSQLGVSGGAPEMDMKSSTLSASTSTADSLAQEPRFNESFASEAPAVAETAPLDPLYVHTQRELEEILREMGPHFEGKESEQNWMARDKSVLKLRRIIKGNAPSEFHNTFMSGLKSLLDGILKVANSLRTTMSTNGCLLVQELARTLGPGLDAMTEILLQNFIKMTANTKNIAAQNGAATVDIIFASVSYHQRLLQHCLLASQDKNVQPRTQVGAWIRTLIKKHASHKVQVEHTGGLDLMEKALSKGLSDPNPKVRENARGTYWLFAQVWPDRANVIMNNLDPKSRSLLEKDPNNPNGASLGASVGSAASLMPRAVAPTLNSTKSSTSLRAAITAQRQKAAAGRFVPDRPNSAQSVLTPARQPSAPNLRGVAGAARPPSALSNARHTRGPPAPEERPPMPSSSVTAHAGGLRSGPIRPPRRPEINRPATADPYARRQQANNVTPTLSPANSPSKDTAKKSTVGKQSMRTPATKPTTQTSPSRPKSRLEQLAQARVRRDSNSSTGTSPQRDETLTQVLPSHDLAVSSSRRRQVMDRKLPFDNETSAIQDDDAFTLVIPSMNLPQVPAPRGSPSKPSTPQKHNPAHGLGNLTFGASPLQATQNARSKSPGRHSPFRAVPLEAEEVKVYEDPEADEEELIASYGESSKTVLEELPINERTLERRPVSSESSNTNLSLSDNSAMSPQRVSPQRQRHYKTTSSGSVVGANAAQNGGAMTASDPSEVARTRRLLASGIDRIRSRTLEAHGFRKVQELIKSHPDLFNTNDDKLDQLFSALVDYLETPAASLPTGATAKSQNLKAQVLATLRVLVSTQRRQAMQWNARMLTAILKARSEYDGSEHMVNDMEKTIADTIAEPSTSLDCLDSVISLIESTNLSAAPPPPSSNQTKTLAASLTTIVTILNNAQSPVAPKQVQRLCRIAVALLSDMDADVRRADTELCVCLHERLAPTKEMDAKFWEAMGEVNNGQKSLITYYIYKRDAAVA